MSLGFQRECRVIVRAALLLATSFGRPLWTQEPARHAFVSSPYLYLHHWAYGHIDMLLERGVLAGLSPVVRPYRRSDITQALRHADTAKASQTERTWLERLRREFRAELQALEGGGRPRVAGELAAEATAMTQEHRDPLRPQGPSRVKGAGEVEFRFAFPGVAGESRLRSDGYYRFDPQTRPGRAAANQFNQRAEDAYVEFQTRYVRLMVGRLYRNWAPPRIQGTVLSDYAYSFDQAAMRAGSDVLSLSMVVARLDDFPGDVRRFLALHRVDYQPSPNLALYGSQAVLYAGPGRDFELEFLNPLSLWHTESEAARTYRSITNNNTLLAVGFWWRAKATLILFGDFTLDDVKLNQGAANGLRYAFYTGLILPRIARTATGRLYYTQVSSLAYRAFADFERYSFRNLGLARDFSDFDLLSAQLDWFPLPAVGLTPTLQILRRGEGDFRDPFPANFDTLPKLFIGTVETTVRLSVAGQFLLGDHLQVHWDAGPNFVSNARHVRGASDREFVGRITVRLATGWSGTLE